MRTSRLPASVWSTRSGAFGRPVAIKVDNGTEFTSEALDKWCFENGVQLDFIRLGKSAENGMIESFNGLLRDECLNVAEFASLGARKRRSALTAVITPKFDHSARWAT